MPSYEELEKRISELEEILCAEIPSKTQAYHQKILDCSSSAIYTKDLHGRYQVINKQFEDLSGFKKKDVISKTDFELFPESVAQNFTKNDRRVIERGTRLDIEELAPVEGRMHTFITTKFPLINEDDGKIYEICGVSTDITKRKQGEDALRESEKKYQHLVESTVDLVWSVDIKGIHTFTNKSIEQHLGYKVEDCIGSDSFQLIHPDDKDNIQKIFQESVDQKKGWSDLEIRWICKDGSIRYFESSAHPIFDVDDNLTGFNGIDRDITDRKQSEDQIESALKEKEILLRELYHRTKNNMQVICSMLSIKSMQITDNEISTVFEEIENRIRVMALVHQKLCQAKDLSRIDLKEYIQDIGNYLLTGSQTYRKILFQVDGDSIPILFDYAVPCGLILNELISNSLRHAFPDRKEGEILISVHIFDNEIEVTFKDNGIGLPKGFNLENCKSPGLGIVRDLIKSQLYGKAELKEAQGMAFQMRFNQSLHKVRI